MFWRHDHCYYCWHRCRRFSLRRGMAALLILAVVVYGVLHAPGLASYLRLTGCHPGHHVPRQHLTPAHPRPGHQRKLPRPADAGQQLPAGKAATPARPGHARRPRSSSHARHASAGRPLGWTNFHGIELPISAAAGPHYTSNGLARGFADSRTGALLAAINIAVRTAAQWGPAIFRPTITRQVTGPNAAALLRADTNAYAQLHGTSPASNSHPGNVPHAAEQAYRVLAYTPANGTVDVVTIGPGSNGTAVLAATRLHVVWLHGDWRLVAPPDGDWARAATPVSSLAGYTVLSAER